MRHHFAVTMIPEQSSNGYNYCSLCGTKLMLVSAREWAVDEEPFKNGEPIPATMDNFVEPGEISGHYCSTCDTLTSFTYNQ